MKSVLLAISVWMLAWTMASAQQQIPLYEGLPAGSESWDWQQQRLPPDSEQPDILYNVVQPTLTAYLPPYYLANGTAVIVAPGGAFHILAVEHEGRQVAEWLNSKGIAAFVLTYRLAHLETADPMAELREKMQDFEQLDRANAPIVPLAMADGLKAMEYVRAKADEYDLHADQIGFMGFSAGATLTMSVVYNATDANRPNFVAPIYAYEPAIIGSEVPKERTPIFVSVAADDELGMLPYSLNIYEKWFRAGQPAELHVYEQGGHGFGMRKQGLPVDSWYERFGEWLQLQGYLKKLYPNKYEKLYGQEAFAKGKVEKWESLQRDYAELWRYAQANQELGLPKEGEDRVVFLGNSITEGWIRTDSAFFADNHFIGRGISAQTSTQLLLRFRQDVLALQPKAVVIHIGTNDIAENTGTYQAEFTMSNIQSMVEIAQAHDIKVILASVLPSTKFEWNRALGDRSDRIVELNQRIRSFATQTGIPYIDYHSAMKNAQNGMDPDIAADGVHPTPKGFQLMKELALPVIQQALKP